MSEIKPFYVCNPEKAEAIEIVERIIANGGRCYDAVSLMEAIPNGGFYPHDFFECWGYRAGYGSYTGTNPSEWDAERLTIPQVRAMLPCEKYDVVKQEWNGEGLPPVGTVCEIKGSPAGCWSVGVIKYIDNRHCVWEWESEKLGTIHNTVNNMEFRTLRTKRDKWIETASQLFHDADGGVPTDAAFGAIYDKLIAKDIEE